MVAGSSYSIGISNPLNCDFSENKSLQSFISSRSLKKSHSSEEAQCTCPTNLSPLIHTPQNHCTCPTNLSPQNHCTCPTNLCPPLTHSPQNHASCTCPPSPTESSSHGIHKNLQKSPSLKSRSSDPFFLNHPAFRHPRCTCLVPPYPIAQENNVNFKYPNISDNVSSGMLRARILGAKNGKQVLSSANHNFIELNDPLETMADTEMQSKCSLNALKHEAAEKNQEVSEETLAFSTDKNYKLENNMTTCGEYIEVPTSIKENKCCDCDINFSSNQNSPINKVNKENVLNGISKNHCSPAKKAMKKLSSLHQKVISSINKSSFISSNSSSADEDLNDNTPENVNKNLSTERYATINNKNKNYSNNHDSLRKFSSPIRAVPPLSPMSVCSSSNVSTSNHFESPIKHNVCSSSNISTSNQFESPMKHNMLPSYRDQTRYGSGAFLDCISPNIIVQSSFDSSHENKMPSRLPSTFNQKLDPSSNCQKNIKSNHCQFSQSSDNSDSNEKLRSLLLQIVINSIEKNKIKDNNDVSSQSNFESTMSKFHVIENICESHTTNGHNQKDDGCQQGILCKHSSLELSSNELQILIDVLTKAPQSKNNKYQSTDSQSDLYRTRSLDSKFVSNSRLRRLNGRVIGSNPNNNDLRQVVEITDSMKGTGIKSIVRRKYHNDSRTYFKAAEILTKTKSDCSFINQKHVGFCNEMPSIRNRFKSSTMNYDKNKLKQSFNRNDVNLTKEDYALQIFNQSLSTDVLKSSINFDNMSDAKIVTHSNPDEKQAQVFGKSLDKSLSSNTFVTRPTFCSPRTKSPANNDAFSSSHQPEDFSMVIELSPDTTTHLPQQFLLRNQMFELYAGIQS